MLKLDANMAKAADAISANIQEAGKYVGVITRAEKLTAGTGTEGLGLSFRSDTGQTADYIDLYHTKSDGETLSALKTVNAIMCCARVAQAEEGPIKCEKWVKSKGAREIVTVTGYPALMGKRIGLLLRKVLETDDKGKDRVRMEIFGVFSAETDLTASEMYAKATTPKRLGEIVDLLAAKPVIDKRAARRQSPAHGGRFDDSDAYQSGDPGSDCPF